MRIIDAPLEERFTPKRQDSAELAALRARLTALEKGMSARTEASAEPETAAPEAQLPFDPAAAEAENREYFRVREQEFVTEQIDPTWGPRAQKTLGDELSTVSEQGSFTVQSVECKTSLCRARLKWNNFSDAGANWRNVLHRNFSENCGHEVHVPPATNPEAPYELSFYFDCTESRAGS
jgi:hypothetical protein